VNPNAEFSEDFPVDLNGHFANHRLTPPVQAILDLAAALVS